MDRWIEIDHEVHKLLNSREFSKAEALLLQNLAEFRASGQSEDIEYITSLLAQFYAMPEVDDRAKAEQFFLNVEDLSKNAHSKLQTAMFYFYVLRDFRKTVEKVDEMTEIRKTPVDADYYSGLTLKGQALIETNDLNGIAQVLEEIKTMAEAPKARLPYGDEINFLESAISNQLFEAKCREILGNVIPKIRSSEYAERAKRLL